MEREILLEKLKKKSDLKIYVGQAVNDPSILPVLLEIIETDKTAVKFLCEKIIRAVSEENPALLYPFFDRMANLLTSENSFIQWGFILSIPNLLKIDSEKKWEQISKRYLSFLDSASIPGFGSAVSGIGKILNSYPDYEKDIVSKLLKIDEHIFLYKGEESPECLNVAKGHIIDCFEQIYPKSAYKKEMLAFVLGNIDNTRSQVRIKAKKFLKKYNMDQVLWEKD